MLGLSSGGIWGNLWHCQHPLGVPVGSGLSPDPPEGKGGRVEISQEGGVVELAGGIFNQIKNVGFGSTI